MGSVLWILLCTGIVILVQARLFSKQAFRGVSYERYFTKSKLYEGEEMELVEVIANRKLLPIPWIRIEARMPRQLQLTDLSDELEVEGDMYHRSSFTLAPYQRITRRHRIKCLARGYYVAESAVMTSGDLFSLSTVSRKIDFKNEVLVYPAPVQVQDLPLPSLKWQGDLVVKRYIMPDMFLYGGIRDYQMGDSIKSIHWGASAATGTLKVKQNDYTAMPRLLIILNAQSSESVWGENPKQDLPDLEEGVRIAASLSAYLIQNGIEVGFASNGRYMQSEDTIYIEPACSSEQNELLLDCFARMRLFRQRSFHQFLTDLPVFKEMDVLVLTRYRSPLADDAAADIVTRGNSLSYYMLGVQEGETS